MAVQGEGIVARVVRGAVAPEPLVIDEPGPGEVLVRVQASGVCHTDLHIRNGAIASLPMLLGHEGAGIVEAVGPGVDQPRVGDYVILAWRAPCGNCRFCRIGQLHLCAASLNGQPRQHTPVGLVSAVGLYGRMLMQHVDVTEVPLDVGAEQGV